ncbi:MAG: type IV pilin protein [Glutamicibacter ardleyensis]
MWAVPKHTTTNKRRGFTIVELLIVIVVIGILAAITIVAYNGVQERSRVQQANAEINSLLKAIEMARINKDTHLYAITGSNCTRCNPDPARYLLTIDRIAQASGANLDSLKDGNPWGDNYSIDENQGEAGPCAVDLIALGTSGKTGIISMQVAPYGC